MLALPAQAYVAPDKNVSYSGSLINNAYFTCTNVTGTFYCYGIANNGATGHVYLERYNETLGGYTTCDMGTVGAYARTYWRGLAVANSTHLIAPQYSCSGCHRLIPMNMSACTSTDSIPPTFNYTGGSAFSGGYYSDGRIYWGRTNGVRNSTTNEWLYDGFWDDSYVDTLRLPNQSDNSTLFGTNGNYMLKYVGGAFDSLLGDASSIYGVTIPSGGWDLFKVNASTTWLYVNGDTRLYRFNFTEMETYANGSTPTLLSPDAGQSVYYIPDLVAELTTDRNGTVTIYLDGDALGSIVVTTYGVQDTQQFGAAPPSLDLGEHSWYAIFVDDLATAWPSETRSFTYTMDSTLTTLLTSPADGIALFIGGLFDVQDLTTARLVSASLLSFVGAIGAIIIITMLTKGHLHASEMTGIFGLSIVVFIIMFTFAGWLPAWVSAIVIVIGAFVFAKLSGLGFVGGG